MIRFFIALALISILNAETIPRPKPIDADKRKLVYRSLTIRDHSYNELFGNTHLPRLTHQELPKQLRTEKSTEFQFVNLAPLFSNSEGYVMGKDEWAIYNTSTSQLHLHASEQLYKLIRINVFTEDKIPLIKIQGRLISVKRQNDPFAEWTMEMVEQSNAKEILLFHNLSRSGELTIFTNPNKLSKHPTEVEIEAVLSEDYSIMDLRLALFAVETESKKKLTLSTGLTLKVNNTFIQPIGISTDKDRLTLLILQPSLINIKGQTFKDH
ncbi:hypothetical protein ACFSW8_16785 [Rubritalea tangerina]|uniref:Uncharacterized protein n=2 Tax=Rubritalea tangerina TaxID=430798 RepID=A0ABW4ZEW9_9BACT